MNTPKIRFNEFEGEWKTFSITDIALLKAGKSFNKNDVIEESGTGSYPCYGGNGHRGFLPYYNQEGKYNIIGRQGALCGCINVAEGKFYATEHAVLVTPIIETDFSFLHESLVRANINQFATGAAQPGISVANVNDQLSLVMPSLNEQKFVGKYFTHLDFLISSFTSRLASLKRVKEASLQAMFPQEGETVPKIRFKGFDGEWKKVKLGEIFIERTENDINGEMLSVTMHDGIIKASENGRFDNSNSDKSNYKLVLENDIAYNSMRMWQGASGCSPYRGIVSPAYTVITPNEGVDSKFFAFYFKTNEIIKKFRLHSQGLTKDTWNLKYSAFSKIQILYPQNELEQQKIASYFTSLDRRISLQTQRLEKLKQIKAACLDKMFV